MHKTATTTLSDDVRIVYSFPKNMNQAVYAYFDTYKGRRYAHVRVLTADADDVDHPTKQGIAVRLDKLDELQTAVEMLVAAAATEAA